MSVKYVIPLCTFLEFYTHLEGNSARSFENAFRKCSRAMMFLKTSCFWWMPSFSRLLSHLKRPKSRNSRNHQRLKPVLYERVNGKRVPEVLRVLRFSSWSVRRGVEKGKVWFWRRKKPKKNKITDWEESKPRSLLFVSTQTSCNTCTLKIFFLLAQPDTTAMTIRPV